ncbi:copper resistance protein NlpE N-terminal domain-containing protein [Elizabethkingia anophelis]
MLIFGFSCINNKSNVNQLVAAEDNAVKGLAIVGTYEGKLPCADCTTIATVLSLDRIKITPCGMNMSAKVLRYLKVPENGRLTRIF